MLQWKSVEEISETLEDSDTADAASTPIIHVLFQAGLSTL